MAATSQARLAGATAADVIDPLADPRWARLVAAAPDASVFHHPEWLALLHRQYGYRMLACCIGADAGEPTAGLPLALISSRLTGRRLVGLPFSDVCPPLGVSEDAGEATGDALGDALEGLREQEGVPLQVRGPLAGRGTLGEVYYRHLVALEPDADAVRGRFTRSSALRGARRAQRDGVVVERRRDADALAAFYRLHLATRRHQGIPTQPRSFILGFSRLFDAGLGFVSVASVEGRPIAAAVFLHFNGVLTYKYGASDRRHLSMRPNNLLFLDAIEWGCAQGLHTLDLGRTDAEQESLRSFKTMWGAQEHELRYTNLGVAPAQSTRSAPKALQHVIRRSPTLVSRGLGEMLYRHAG